MARDAKMKIVVGAENQARGPLRSVSDDIAGLSRQAQTTNDKLSSLGASIGNWATGMAVAFAANEARKFAADSIQAFSSLNESVSKSRVVFKDSAGTIADFAKSAARNLGMSRQAATEAAGTFGNLFTSMGLGIEQSADMSVGLVKLAADLASFNNIDPSVALEKLRAGMVGEVEPLRALGINLSAAAVNAKAYAMGLAEAGETVSTAGLLQARYALALEQSTNAQGDFARTSDGLANSQRIAAAATEDLKAALGALVAQPYTVVVKAVTQGVQDLTTTFSEGVYYRKGADPVVKATYERIDAERQLAEQLRIAAEAGSDYNGQSVEFARNALIMAQEAEGAALRTKMISDGLNEVAVAAGVAAENVSDFISRLQGIPYGGIPDLTAYGTRLTPTISPLRPVSEYENAFMGGGGAQVSQDNFLLNMDKLRDAADEWQRAQETANTKAAAQWSTAYNAQIAKVESVLDQGMTTSIKLQDMRPGGAGGLGADPNGPFAEIYRLQAWINDGTWAETAAKFGVQSKEQGAEIVKKFQTGLWDESVTKMIDEKAIERAVLTEQQADAFKKAFAEKIAKATGAGTNVVGALLYGSNTGDTTAATNQMIEGGQSLGGGLIKGVIKAQPDLEKEGYNAAMSYKAGWAAGMASGATGGASGSGSGSGSTGSGYKKTGREYGAE
jgi:hypothetical protein